MNLQKTLWKGSTLCKHRPNFTGGVSEIFYAGGLGLRYAAGWGEGCVGYECPLISFNYASESDLNEFSFNMSISNETQPWCNSNRTSKTGSVIIFIRNTYHFIKIIRYADQRLYTIKYCFQDIWPTYMCPVTEKIVPKSPDLLHRWTIIHLYLFII